MALFFGCSMAGLGLSQDGSGIRVAVIDMQEVLNKYYKTKIEINKLNALVDRREAMMKKMAEAMKEPLAKLKELQEKIADESLSDTARKEAKEQFQKLALEEAGREKLIAYRRQKAAVEIATARKEMETTLLVEIKREMKGVIKSNGIDLVLDKSFLPKANKAIIYTSARVIDLSGKLVESLNKKVPTATSTPSNSNAE